jgi:hypothetical protein
MRKVLADEISKAGITVSQNTKAIGAKMFIWR